MSSNAHATYTLQIHEQLEQRVAERTATLTRSNQAWEKFAEVPL